MMLRYVLALFFSCGLFAAEDRVHKDEINPQDVFPVHLEQKMASQEPMISVWQEQVGPRLALGGFIVHKATATIEEGKVVLDLTLQPARTGALFFLPPPLWAIQGTGAMQEYSFNPFSLPCVRRYQPPLFPELFVPKGVLYHEMDAENQKLQDAKANVLANELFHYQAIKQRVINSTLFVFMTLIVSGIVLLLFREGVFQCPQKRHKTEPFNFHKKLEQVFSSNSSTREKLHQGFLLFKQSLCVLLRQDCCSMTTYELIACVERTSLSLEEKRMLYDVCHAFAEQLYCEREITEEDLQRHFHHLHRLPLRHEEVLFLKA